MSYCAPNVEISEHWTCFDRKELEEIALAFNIYIQKNRVCGKNKCAPRKLIDIRSKTKQELWHSIYRRLAKICRYEYCWIDQSFIQQIQDPSLREKIKYFTFKPKSTRKRNSWLSTTDINAVMQQYQEVDASFKFLGALPSDFYTQVQVRYGDVYKYKRVGIVFNLDRHDQPGSHWVAFMIDNTKQTIEYFDSAARPPNAYIKGFIGKLTKEGPGLSQYTYLENKIVHQKENNECGVYAIYFLVQRLYGKDFKTVSTNVINDFQMNLFRDNIFRPK
jgi:hypothetical protein